MKKGISPFIASVFLIAFAVVVAGVYSGWLTGFVKRTGETTEEKAGKRISCIYGGISLSDLVYNRTTENLTGTVENIDVTPLGNIDLEIFYADATKQEIDLNLELEPGEKDVFNVNIPKLNTTAYDKVRVITNCSNVYDEISSISMVW